MAFSFNVVTFYLIKQIGPLTSTLLGNLKTIILVLVAAMVVDTAQLTWLNLFGCAPSGHFRPTPHALVPTQTTHGHVFAIVFTSFLLGLFCRYAFFFIALFTYSYLNFLKSQNRLRYPACPFPFCCEALGDGQGPLPDGSDPSCCFGRTEAKKKPVFAEEAPQVTRRASGPQGKSTETSKLIGGK